MKRRTNLDSWVNYKEQLELRKKLKETKQENEKIYTPTYLIPQTVSNVVNQKTKVPTKPLQFIEPSCRGKLLPLLNIAKIKIYDIGKIGSREGTSTFLNRTSVVQYLCFLTADIMQPDDRDIWFVMKIVCYTPNFSKLSIPMIISNGNEYYYSNILVHNLGQQDRFSVLRTELYPNEENIMLNTMDKMLIREAITKFLKKVVEGDLSEDYEVEVE